MKDSIRIKVLLSLVLIVVIVAACNKVKTSTPILSTTDVTEVTSTTATSGGVVTDEGGAALISRGVCYNTTTSPAITDNKTNQGGSLGSFVSKLTLLTPNTLYYVRAYATNSAGTGYGNEVTFTTRHDGNSSLFTSTITSITKTTAVSGGTILDTFTGTVISRGVCWSTQSNPTPADNKTTDGNGIGSFVSNLSSLVPGTTYYVRMYATTSTETSYGDELIFATIGTVTDIDGNVYNTLRIGEQTWMAENLRTTRYRNATAIGTTTPATLNIASENVPKYQWPYGGNEANVVFYGRLYTYYTVTDSRGVCPSGWHVPTDTEWITLTTSLGGITIAGGKMKETGTAHWLTPNTGATNESGFSALPGGVHQPDGSFLFLGSYGFWWCSNGFSSYGWFREMHYNLGDVYRDYLSMQFGLSVRCIKD